MRYEQVTPVVGVPGVPSTDLEIFTEVELVYENWSGLTTQEDPAYFPRIAELMAKAFDVVHETYQNTGRRVTFMRRVSTRKPEPVTVHISGGPYKLDEEELLKGTVRLIPSPSPTDDAVDTNPSDAK